MPDVLPYTRWTRNPRLNGVRNCLNIYFFLYARLTRSRIRVELASLAYLGLRIIFNIYFAMYKRLTRFRTHVELASLAYLDLKNILIIILPSMHVWCTSVWASNSHPPPTWGEELFK